MGDQSTLRQFGAAVESLQRAVTFRVWINGGAEIAGCTALAEAANFDEALAAVIHWAGHKDNISILRDDAGRSAKVLRIYTVKQESQRKWRTDPVTRVPVAYRKTYPVLIHQMEMDAFEPTRPFDAFRDDPVGRDLTLVSQ